MTARSLALLRLLPSREDITKAMALEPLSAVASYDCPDGIMESILDTWGVPHGRALCLSPTPTSLPNLNNYHLEVTCSGGTSVSINFIIPLALV